MVASIKSSKKDIEAMKSQWWWWWWCWCWVGFMRCNFIRNHKSQKLSFTIRLSITLWLNSWSCRRQPSLIIGSLLKLTQQPSRQVHWAELVFVFYSLNFINPVYELAKSESDTRTSSTLKAILKPYSITSAIKMN